MNGLLRVVFIPNYDVSTAADIIPAADLSEQISLAGMEASGTGNMKLSLNGALTIGTQDGANIEIAEAVGEENIFTFDLNSDEVPALWQQGYYPEDYLAGNEMLRRVIDMITTGYFSPDDAKRYHPLVDSLRGHDQYMLFADYAAYIDCQHRVDDLYHQSDEWARKAIINVARMGRFSSDRTINEYATKVWGAEPVVHE